MHGASTFDGGYGEEGRKVGREVDHESFLA